MLVIWQVRVSNAAVYFQIVLTTCDAVKKPVTHILVIEMTKLLHQSMYHFTWVTQREIQGYKSDVSLKRGIQLVVAWENKTLI